MHKDSTSKNVLVFGLGLAAGWFVKQLFDSPEFAQKKDALIDRTTDIRNRLMDSDEAARIKEIFGKTSDELTSVYQETKEKVVSELGMLKTSLEDIDKQRYIGLVTDIVAQLRSDSRLSGEQLEALTQALTDDYSKIKRKRSQLIAKNK